MSLVAVHSIRKEYRNKVVLSDVSLQVEHGDRIALIGANGSGKSTLLKIIMGLEIPDGGEVFKSKRIKIGYLSQSLDHYDYDEFNALHYEALFELENKLRRIEVQLESEEPNSEAYELILEKYTTCMVEFDHMDGYVLQNRIKKILLGLGLRKGALLIPLSKLSGGEKMRVALARLLLNEPDLLILDEPTNHLDIKAIEWLESYLKKFAGGVLMVSHDRMFLDRVTTRIGEIQAGHLTTKKCNYTSYLEQKSRLTEFYLKEQQNLQKQIRDERLMVEKLRKYKKIKQSKSREIGLQKLEEKAKSMMMTLKSSENLNTISGPGLSLNNDFHLSHEVVVIENLHKWYDDYHILNDLSLTIYGGEKIAIVGPNGCGKTTLLNIILGKDKNYTGDVKLGSWIKYAYLGQEVTFEDEELSVLETVIDRLKVEPIEARKILSRFQFYGDVIESKIKILSGGERVRIVLACIMEENPHCLILDEPTNHLDLESRISIENAISAFKGTVIAISHDRYFLKHCVSKIVEIKEGFLVDYDAAVPVEIKKEKKKAIVVKPAKVKVIDTNKIESDIEAVELLVKEFEESIHPDMSYEDYKVYDDWLKELELLYQEFDHILEGQ